MLKTLESAVERWKHGAALVFMLALLVAASALIVGAPLAVLAEAFGKPSIAHWSNIAIGTALLSLPYMLTIEDISDILRRMLNPNFLR